MSASLRYGCALLTFSPSFFSLIIILSRRPQLVILAIASCFSWLISALLSAIFWHIQYLLFGDNVWFIVMLFSTVFQEICRLGLVITYRKTESIIKSSSKRANEAFPLNDISSSFAAGVGFGSMHSLMTFGALLAASTGNGDLFVDSCPAVPLVLFTALLALGFCILDVILMYLAFIAEKLKSRAIFGIIIGIHFIAALTTLGNSAMNGCSYSIFLLYVVITVAGFLLRWMWPLLIRGVPSGMQPLRSYSMR